MTQTNSYLNTKVMGVSVLNVLSYFLKKTKTIDVVPEVQIYTECQHKDIMIGYNGHALLVCH